MNMKAGFDIPYGAEQWRPLNYQGKILHRYMVSDYGRVYDNQINEFLPYYHMRGEYWHVRIRRDISCNYNFMGGNQFKLYNEDFAYLVCCFLSDPNRDFTYDEIADFLDIPKNERLNFKQYVNKLITGRTSVKITEQYNLKRPKDYYEDCSFGYANRQYA